MVVFTGDSDRIADPEARRSHDALASAVKLLRHEDLMPREPAFARLFRRTREISQPALDRLMRTSELARARAKPLLDWIIERAAPRM